MTEKRFYVDKSPITHLFVPYDREKEFVFEGVETGNTIMKLVGLLNNALEENEQLKFELKECREHKLYSRRELEKENEQLKQTMQVERRELISANNDYREKLFECRKENEELKQQNENLLAKLKFTAEQLNYSENLKKMLDGDVE